MLANAHQHHEALSGNQENKSRTPLVLRYDHRSYEDLDRWVLAVSDQEQQRFRLVNPNDQG